MAKEKEPILAPVIETESWEERNARERQGEFLRRNAEALAARREILTTNGLPDDTQDADPSEAAKRCCS